jgi:hypothetical protein
LREFVREKMAVAERTWEVMERSLESAILTVSESEKIEDDDMGKEDKWYYSSSQRK